MSFSKKGTKTSRKAEKGTKASRKAKTGIKASRKDEKMNAVNVRNNMAKRLGRRGPRRQVVPLPIFYELDALFPTLEEIYELDPLFPTLEEMIEVPDEAEGIYQMDAEDVTSQMDVTDDFD